ncbi:MAG: MFS transporter [Nitriliruptoraceae bacterium]
MTDEATPDTPRSADTADAAAPTEELSGQTAEFDRPNVLFLSGAHFIHDCYPAFLGVLLPLLIPRLGLSFAAAGILASSVRWTTSLQPVLGYWADRTDTRYWVIAAPAVTATCMSFAGLAPSAAVLLILLLTTGLSHAAFHPAAGALVTRVAGDRWGKGTSFFMTGGEFGRVIGPVTIAAVIGAVGLDGAWIILIPGVLASLALWRRFRHADIPVRSSAPARLRDALRAGRGGMAMLSAFVFMRSFMNVGFIIFYPTYATGRGSSLLLAGLALTAYESGGTLGAFTGGILSDRFGRPRTMTFGLLIAAPALATAVALGPTPVGLAILAVGGLGLLSATSVELVIMQRLMPDHRSSAVGFTYFMKAAGGTTATVAIGAMADSIGLQQALYIGIAIGLAALPFVIFLKRVDRTVDAGTRAA